MPLLVPKRTSISEIMLAIRQKLIDAQVLPPDRIFIVARESQQLRDHQAPEVIYIRPRGMVVDQLILEAGGRYTTRIIRIVDIFVRVRNQRDKSMSDIQWLTDADQSYFKLEEAVMNVLNVAFLEDGVGNELLCEPMRPVSTESPQVDRGKLGWGNAAASYEVHYLFASSPLANY